MRSQNGWAASSNRAELGITNPAIAGVTFPGGIRGGDAGIVLRHVAEQYHRRVEPLVKGWCWGHAYRAVRGSASTSNHASGTAIDCNAPRHPLGRRGTFNDGQVAAIREILRECSGVVRWGGDYAGRPDEMHFELNADAGRVADAARLLVAPPAPPPPPPPPAGGGPVGARLLRLTVPFTTGDDVKALQRVLNRWYPWLRLAEDGVYGPATEAGVRELQRRAGIGVDGIAGPQTRRVLGL